MDFHLVSENGSFAGKCASFHKNNLYIFPHSVEHLNGVTYEFSIYCRIILLFYYKVQSIYPRLKSSLQQFQGPQFEQVDSYEISISQMEMDLLSLT